MTAARNQTRLGDWMTTSSGRTFWPLDPRADEVHEFFLLQPDLPFPGQNLRASNKHQRSLAGIGLDAEQLARVQKALGSECLAVRLASKGVLSLYPGDDADGDPDQIGFLALFAGGPA